MVTIQNLQTFVLTEESITVAQTVSTLGSSEAAVFDIIQGNDDNWLHIDASTGTVSLTPDGVQAINLDNPTHPEEEVSVIEFRIEATSLLDESTDVVDVLIGVIRVHDEEPVIIDEIITPLYADDSTTGLRVVEIRTAYAAQFTVLAGADKLQILSPVDVGRALLTSTGAIHVNNQAEPTLDFSIIITDLENGLEITKEYSLDILPGSARELLPTKNILDLSGEFLGAEAGAIEAGNDIEHFKIKLDTDYYFSEIEDIILNGSKNTLDIDKLTLKLIEQNESTDLKIDALNASLNISLDAVKDDFTAGFINELNSMKALEHKMYLMDNSRLSSLQARVNNLVYLNESSRISLQNYIHHQDDRIALEASVERLALEARVESLISALRIEFEDFVSTTFELYKDDVNIRFISAEDRLDVNEGDIDALEVTSGTHDTRLTVVEAAVSAVASNTLEDIDNSNGWDFTINTLAYKQQSILSISGNTTVFGTQGSGSITVNDASFGNSGLVCYGSVFSGTATKAKYADLAEYYTIQPNTTIGPGRLVNFTANHKEYEIELADGIKDPLGIITTNPGFILNDPDNKEGNWSAIALAGRTPVFASNASHAERGDYLYQDELNPTIGCCYKVRNPNKIQLGIVIQYLGDGIVEVKI